MPYVRATLFALCFYSWTVIAVLVSFPASLLGGRALRNWCLIWARGHRLCAAWLLGIRTRVEGTRPEGAVLVAAKHQSMYETIEIMLLLDLPAVVVKHELADIPLWGWVVRRYGVIPIDRAGGASALRRMMRAAQVSVSQGRPIAIFPEGTRVPPGQQPPLQSGFAGLYRVLRLPVVPMAVDSGRLWPRHQFLKRPGIVTMRFGEPIAAGLPRAEIEAAVHQAINVLESES